VTLIQAIVTVCAGFTYPCQAPVYKLVEVSSNACGKTVTVVDVSGTYTAHTKCRPAAR